MKTRYRIQPFDATGAPFWQISMATYTDETKPMQFHPIGGPYNSEEDAVQALRDRIEYEDAAKAKAEAFAEKYPTREYDERGVYIKPGGIFVEEENH